MSGPKPTDAERADAFDRYIDRLDAAVRCLFEAHAITREGQEPGSIRSGPAFTWNGEKLQALTDKARDLIWDAAKVAAAEAYGYHRAAGHIGVTEDQSPRPTQGAT